MHDVSWVIAQSLQYDEEKHDEDPLMKELGLRPRIHFPTCISDWTHITDFTDDDKRKANPFHLNPWWHFWSDMQFPLTCGSWASEQTSKFLEGMHMHVNSTARQDGRIDELFDVFHKVGLRFPLFPDNNAYLHF